MLAHSLMIHCSNTARHSIVLQMHLDFFNNTLLGPSRCVGRWDDTVDDVQGIVFLNDSRAVGGCTAFLPGLQHSKDERLGGAPVDREAMYLLEQSTQYSTGSVLLYQLGTWHRGVPVAAGAVRRTKHLSFRKAGCDWIGGSNESGHPSAKSIYQLAERLAARDRQEGGGETAVGSDFMASLMGSLSPVQREVIGFPAVTSKYWALPGTLDGVAQRYGPALDMKPYYAAANQHQQPRPSKL